MYLGLLGASGLFIFVNNITIKYNYDQICGVDEAKLGIGADGVYRAFP